MPLTGELDPQTGRPRGYVTIAQRTYRFDCAGPCERKGLPSYAANAAWCKLPACQAAKREADNRRALARVRKMRGK